MSDAMRPRVKYVIGPDGSPLTVADLPPPSTRRWVIRRKAEVVAAVRGGLLSLDELIEVRAVNHNPLSEDEVRQAVSMGFLPPALRTNKPDSGAQVLGGGLYR